MKKILIGLSFIIMLCLCSCGDSLSSREYKSMNIIKNHFPNSEVHVIHGEQFKYIVKDSNEDVWYVECMNSGDDEISYMVRVFKINKEKVERWGN